MLKVECESCKAPYQVDERRVPPTGLKMRCPKCGHTFLVTDPSKGAPPAADGGGLPKPPPPKKATMVGLAPKPAPASTSAKAAPPFPQSAPNVPAAPGPQIPSLDFDAALPAVKPAAPPYKPPPGPSFASSKPTAPAMAAQQAPSPPPFGGLDDLDLPALAGDVGLPAAVHRPPPKPAPIAAPPPAAIAPPAAPAGPPKLDFEVDLPALPSAAAPPPPAPAAFAGGFGSLDLPAPKRPGQPDLPSAKPGGGGFGDLPMAKPGGFADLPSAAAGGGLPIAKAVGGGGFGEIDLPSLQNDLPQHSFGGGGNLPSAVGAGAHLPTAMGANAHLPTAMGAGAHLPTAMGAGAHLPTAMGAGAHLPTAMGAGAHLPTAMGAGAHLPTAMGPNAHLPTSMGAGAHLPTAMGANAHMPQAVSDDRLLPNKQGGPGAIAFGELDLPLVGAQGGDPGQVLPSPANRGGLNFGEVDLPGDGMGGTPSALPPPQSGGSAGGMGFGEVDLGGGDSSAPIGPPVAATGGNFPFKEASLDAGGPSATPGRLRPRSAEDRAPSKLPKLVGIAAAIIVVGGAALQFTPLGAFGYLWIGDKLHSGEQVSDATSKADFARKKLALDTFPSAVQAADDLLEARKRAPRSRPLGAYTAFCEYMNEVRFGIDPARAARVNTFLTEIPAEVEVPYLRAAQAAQSAQAGDWEKAKTAVDLAAAKEPKDGIQHELSILKGEIALAQRDPATALTAFNAAHASGGSARTFFGIARAHFMAKAYPKAREAVDNVIKASPNHAGAITLRGQLAWEMQRDDVAALKDITSVLADTNRKTLGPSEVSYALAAKGWIMFARDRAGEARAAFDEAVKIDPRNVSALVGQGEVLYADGRYTEALTRFDDAVSKDASSISAILGSAKTKIALERLADSKAQLTAARQKWPKDMNVALWLARTEEALGNKKAAEELYSSAIDLGDPQTAEAIQAYAAYAKFLASQGKNVEAAAKLEQARSKLPDTAALQRAFGEVAAAQGQWEEALTHFDQALAKNPNDLGTRFRLGQAYRHMRRLDQAAKALDEVAAIDKDYPNLALERGLLFEQSGDVQKALEQFQSASQKAPNDIDLMLRVGAAYVAIGETEKALPLLLKVKDQRPNSAEANHFVGRAYLKQGGLESAAAMRYLQRAVALDPNRPEYHLYVAWAANEATPAQLGLARTHIDKALQLDKLLADGYWQRGVLERKEGQINDAIKDLKKALELKPSRHEAHATLAEAYQDKNDLAGAMSEWQKAIAGDDKPAYWRFRYGKLLADKNQNAEASKHLVYAVETGKAAQPRPGWLGSAAFEAGETLHKTGQKKEACEHYQLFMELAAPTSPDRRDAIKAMNELGCPYENR